MAESDHTSHSCAVSLVSLSSSLVFCSYRKELYRVVGNAALGQEAVGPS